MKNIIETDKSGSEIQAKLHTDFNLRVKHMLESRLSPEVSSIRLDMQQNRTDSEGIIFLHRWLKKGNKLSILNPPPILYEILDILELHESWDLDTIIIDN